MELKECLQQAVSLNGSDIFIIPGSVMTVKVKGKLVPLTQERLMPADTQKLVEEMYTIANRDTQLLFAGGDDDFSFSVRDLSRFRCNAYRQRGTSAAICAVMSWMLSTRLYT